MQHDENEPPDGSLSGRRVLIVEDQSMVAMLLEDTLAELGCEIVGMAASFDEAAEKAASLSFDVAIVDINLNGEHTTTIAERMVLERRPLVLTTGYGSANLPSSLQRIPLLQKPFALQELRRAIRQALAGNQEG
jgi:DNA-binding NarL/FixJ family response regulator